MSEVQHLLLFDRFYGSAQDTLSVCYFDGEWVCMILEDEYREIKVAGETRIPAGRYRVVLEHSPKFSERYGHKMLTVAGVQTHSGIRIHKGRIESHTDGCPLTGLGFHFLEDGRAELIDPDKAYTKLYGKVAPVIEAGDVVWLEIVDEKQGLPAVRVK